MSKILFRRISNIINSLWAVPVVVLIRLFRPLYYLRIGTICHDRIGHFCVDFAEQFARLKLKKNKAIDLYWLGETCNKQWEKMVRRSLPVYDFLKYVDYWNNKIPGGRKHARQSTLTNSRDIYGSYQKNESAIPFTLEETETAKAWLRNRGWSDGESFVCLLVRDSAYLSMENNLQDASDWSYHSYRESDIDTYNEALLWLAERGVWVLRMGKVMRKEVSISHPKIIDYAFDDKRSDLLDIWLFANCNSCITTSSGLDVISPIYSVPILYINAMPLSYIPSYSSCTWVPKNMIWSENARHLTCLEYFQNSFLRSDEYKAAGVSLVDLSENEILEAVKEFWYRANDKYAETKQERMLQNRFWTELKAWSDFSKYHYWIHPEARVGSAWLRSQDENFFSSDVVGQVEERRNIKDEVLVN